MLLVLLLLDEAEALVPAVLLCEFLEGCPGEKEILGSWGRLLHPHQKSGGLGMPGSNRMEKLG